MPARKAGVRGLREFSRALRDADKGLQRELRARLLGLAGDVATEAKAIAQAKGLHDSGDLIRKIRPFARIGGAGVRSGAMHDGYDYPRRLEYEHRNGRPWGTRAFLNPAVDDRRNSVFDMAERLLDDVADDLSKET